MKILYIGHTYTVRANHAKIAALAKQPGVEIVLVTPQAWKGPLYRNETDRFDSALAPNVHHRILKAWGIGKEGAYLFSPSIFPLIARLQPDIVHVEQGAYALVYLQVLLALKLFSRQSRSIFFTWWNLPYQPKGIKKIAERFNLSHSTCAIAGNARARDVLREHGFMKPVHVLPQLGVEPLPLRTEQQHSNAPFCVGYAGRITEEKGVFDLVRAVSRMQHVGSSKLYCVGAGEALDRAKREAAYHGIDFEWHPPVRNDELPAHLEKMDVLVLPSRTTPRWVEQFGHILLEAMAAGIPVVGSNSGEIPNVIGNAGIIFEEGNAEALAQVLDRIFENEEERTALADRGVERIRKQFTHETIAQTQFRIYEWMLREGLPVGRNNRSAGCSQDMATPVPGIR